MLTVAERLLLKKCMVLRRIQNTIPVPLTMLVNWLEEDQLEIRTQRPDYYISTGDALECIRECIDDGMVRETAGPGGQHFIRLPLGDTFLRTLEQRLVDAFDDLPISGKGLLDFLARA